MMLFLALGLLLLGAASSSKSSGEGDLVSRVVARACIQERDLAVLSKLRDLCASSGRTALASALEARILEVQPMASVAVSEGPEATQTFGGIMMQGPMQGPAPQPAPQNVVQRAVAISIRR